MLVMCKYLITVLGGKGGGGNANCRARNVLLSPEEQGIYSVLLTTFFNQNFGTSVLRPLSLKVQCIYSYVE